MIQNIRTSLISIIRVQVSQKYVHLQDELIYMSKSCEVKTETKPVTYQENLEVRSNFFHDFFLFS